ncbi:MAG: FapA family protein [Candidatus Hinthialibacter antarcticus]|nr:FapA family protein [Candidatus Hinthialibacter antarcticus]
MERLEKLLGQVDLSLHDEHSAKDSFAETSELKADQVESLEAVMIQAGVSLVMNHSHTKAWLRFHPSLGRPPKKYDARACLKQLNEMGVIQGVIERNALKGFQLLKNQPDVELEIVIAVGRDPIPIENFRRSFWIAGEAPIDESVEVVVRKNELLLKLETTGTGEPGIDIYGHTLEAPVIDNEPPKVGANIHTKNGHEYYSSLEGTLKVNEGVLSVRPNNKDAAITISVDENGMRALLSIEPPQGLGRGAYFQDIENRLSKLKVVRGIDRVRIREAIKQANEQLKPVQQWQIARGKPARHGKNGSIEWICKPTLGKKFFSIGEDGGINFYNLQKFSQVPAGEHLVSVQFPTQGMNGFDIHGHLLEGKAGKAANLEPGEGIRVDNDGKDWFSTLAGRYRFENDVLSVSEVLEIDGDVDFSVGNIDFRGDVVIRGSVLDDFKVKASGSVTVVGAVEAAEISAGKDVEIKKGIFGKEQGTVSAQRDVIAGFLQNADIRAGRDVAVGTQILNSQVMAARNIELRSGKGAVVGGRCVAGHTIVSRIVGAEYGTRTEIEVGIDFAVMEVMATMSQKMKNNTELLKQLNEAIRSYQDLDERLLDRAQEKCNLLEQKIKTQREAYQALAKKLHCTKNPSVIAGIIYPDVFVRMHDARYKFRTPQHTCVVTYDEKDEKIHIKSKETNSDSE